MDKQFEFLMYKSADEDISVNALIRDETDHFIRIERSKTGFDFEEEKLAKAFSELSLMRREVLRLLFVEENTPCEIARQLCISPNCVYQFKHQALAKLKRELTKGDGLHG